MNTKSPKEAEIPLRGENHSSSDYHHHHHPNDDKSKASSSGGSAQWLRLKDPRIVRVSRALGGKDRHSKVCTVRGLRDRRVRLSVPTAIQLYDLQDRLGLNQPSKVVDWLLNAAKHEIDELPPLQIPPGSTLSLCQYPSLVTCNDNNDNNNEDGSASQRNEEDHREDNELSRPNHHHHHHHHSSFRGLLNTMPLGYNNNNINQWEQPHNLHSADLLLQAPQILVCPPGGAAQPYVPNSHHIAPIDMDPRQITQYQMLSSSSNSQNLLSNSLTPSLYPLTMSQSVKPFSLSMMTPNTSENQSHNKDHDFPSK